MTQKAEINSGLSGAVVFGSLSNLTRISVVQTDTQILLLFVLMHSQKPTFLIMWFKSACPCASSLCFLNLFVWFQSPLLLGCSLKLSAHCCTSWLFFFLSPAVSACLFVASLLVCISSLGDYQ